MTITALPTPPDRSNPSTFASLADAFLGALPTFVTEANALAAAVNEDAGDAAASAASVDAAKWVSGQAYAEGDVAWSPLNFKAYRAKGSTSGTTDPSQDAANWALINGLGDLQSEDTVFLGSIQETVEVITDGASVDLDPANGTVKVWTLGANRTPTLTMANGHLDVSGMDIQEGDFVIVYWAANGIADFQPSGYTELAALRQTGTNNATLEIFYKEQTSTPDTTITIPQGTGLPWDAVGLVQVWRNAIAPQGVQSSSSTDDVRPDPPAIDALRGDVVVFAGAGAHDDGVDTFSSSDADLTSGGASDNNDITLGVGFVSIADDATFNPAQFSSSLVAAPVDVSHESVAATFIIRGA